MNRGYSYIGGGLRRSYLSEILMIWRNGPHETFGSKAKVAFLTEETATVKTLTWEEAWSISQAEKDGQCDSTVVCKGQRGTAGLKRLKGAKITQSLISCRYTH